jgi:phosphopantothenoylcysteine decarboxylase/phosphopantothenate--cysteine ligase
MENLYKKQILIGITGGIAAYKSAELVRLLIKQGYSVKVCMTQAATQFITPLTLQALSGHPVHTDLLDTHAEAAMGHIALAKWADQIIIAPCSADFMARLAWGFANDLLSTLCLASAAPLAIAPAMNQQMWQHPAVQDNLNCLIARNVSIWGPASGQQACGDIGLGRMLEAAEIVTQLENIQPQNHTQAQTKAQSQTPQSSLNVSLSTLSKPKIVAEYQNLLQGQRILISAGATREAIDPVRFISNRSSGKMGYAIASAAQAMGAEVTLVSGVVALETPEQVKRINVESAVQMYEVILEQAKTADIFIATAAVSDYSPIKVDAHKIKKTADHFRIELKKTPDILAELSQRFTHIFTLGFAAETENLIHYAQQKLKNKKLDMIAANWVGDGKAFDQPDNALEILWNEGRHSLPKMDKQRLAYQLLAVLAQRYQYYQEVQMHP